MTTEQIQEIPQPIQPVQQVPVELKKKLSLSTIVILLVAIVLIGVGGIYAVKRLSQPKACTLEVKLCPDGSSVGRTGPNCEFAPCPTKISSATPTPDETAGWKTYKNEKYGFEIKYPDNWIVNTVGDSIRFQTFPEPSPGYGGFPGGANDIQVGLSVKANSEGLGLEKFFTKQSLGRIVKSKQSIVLGNISGIIATYDEEVGAGMPEVYSVVNSFLIEGIVSSGSNDIKEKAISTFNQILSTFKFLD